MILCKLVTKNCTNTWYNIFCVNSLSNKIFFLGGGLKKCITLLGISDTPSSPHKVMSIRYWLGSIICKKKKKKCLLCNCKYNKYCRPIIVRPLRPFPLAWKNPRYATDTPVLKCQTDNLSTNAAWFIVALALKTAQCRDSTSLCRSRNNN